MEFTQNINGSSCDMAISGKFTFADRQVFRDLFKDITSQDIKKLSIELSQVEFVDSAALGILLLARDEAEKSETELILKSPQGQVKRMFEISKFHDLFNIVE